MFTHNFKYSLKVLFRNKSLIFWTYIFPLILALLFNLAFKDIESNEVLKTIDIAVVNSESFENDTITKNILKELSSEENKIFNIEYTDLEKSKELLENKEISGYIIYDNDIKIVINNNGINETILKYTLDEIQNTKNMVNIMLNSSITKEINNGNININYNEIYNNIMNKISNTNIKLNDISNKNLSYTMIEYYTLIAMAALYGSMLSMYITNYNDARMCPVGKRKNVSPTNKMTLIVSGLLSSYIVQLIGMFILFMFMIFILKIEFIKLEKVIFLSLLSSLAGLSLGVFVSSVFKAKENTKTGIIITITMICCYLSGMMGITMKYIIDTNIPIINKINPANMITDALYSLYYYEDNIRYSFNIISLIIFSTIMILISYLKLRREKYDSI